MRKVVLAAVLVLMASSAQAVTLTVIGGQLMGASGVVVDGGIYDVEFVDGTCIDLFNGCDGPTDFTFTDEASATLASQALLDQVFLDGPQGSFDDEFGLTNGCSPSSTRCTTNTAFAVSCPISGFPPKPGWFCNIGANNRSSAGGTLPDYDSLFYGQGAPTFDSVPHLDLTWAKWSFIETVPEPSTALLLGLGLAGMAARRRV